MPVIYDFPSGHGAKNISIPLGVIAEINTEDKKVVAEIKPISEKKTEVN